MIEQIWNTFREDNSNNMGVKEMTFKKETKVKTDCRPPFKFSMIGLKRGDVVCFEYGNIPVMAVSENISPTTMNNIPFLVSANES